MENKEKINRHPLKRVFYDILRDTNSIKYSMTKFAALTGLFTLLITVIMSLVIMWEQKEIDHVLIVELLGFILTLLGFKNSFGYKGKDQSISTNGNLETDENVYTEKTKNDTTEKTKNDTINIKPVTNDLLG